MTLDDFLPYILPRAKGCPDYLAKRETRLAIIDFCEKSLIWRAYQPAILSVIDQTAYDYTPAADQQVMQLLGMTLAGEPVDVVDPTIGKDRDAAGHTQTYAYGTFTGFEIRPAPAAAGLEIVTYAAVAPSITATTVPDALSKYIEGISAGALARVLLGDKDDPYHDPDKAGIATGVYDAAVNKARQDALTGSARVKIRTAKVLF